MTTALYQLPLAIFGTSLDDTFNTGAGNDVIEGGAGTDKIVCGSDADTNEGGEGDDQLRGGTWGADGTVGPFVFAADCGKDDVHDFETGFDVLDLTAFETGMSSVSDAATDLGWCTVIDLGQLARDTPENKVVLMNVDLADLGQENFIF